MWLVAPDGGCVGTRNPRSSTVGMELRGEPARRAPPRVGNSTTDLWRIPMVRTLRPRGPPGWAAATPLAACHDRRAMNQHPYTPPPLPLPLAGDGYPAAGGVDRRTVGTEES